MERRNKMPIKVGGVVVDIGKITETTNKAQPQQVSRTVVENDPVDMTPPPRRIIKQKPRPKITDGHKLVVDGKEKTIGRKSQYLLDMMIIDDE